MKWTLMFPVLALALVGLLAMDGAAQSNPCNPCGDKAANPCNPCGGNPCNPCGGMAKAMGPRVPVNPCDAKLGMVFHIDDPAGRNTVTFKSTAPLEDIVGISTSVHGYIAFNPCSPTRGGKGMLVIPTASLVTGIPLRDEHLRSADWLDAKSFPNIEFRIESARSVKETKRGDGYRTWDMTLDGELSIHGRTRHISVPARVTHLKESEMTRQKRPGDLLAGRVSFELVLADFGIRGPLGADLIGTKVGETITLEVSFVAGSEPLTGGANPCNPCGMNPCNPCSGKNPCNPCGPRDR